MHSSTNDNYLEYFYSAWPRMPPEAHSAVNTRSQTGFETYDQTGALGAGGLAEPRDGASPQQISAEPQVHGTWAYGQQSTPDFLALQEQPTQFPLAFPNPPQPLYSQPNNHSVPVQVSLTHFYTPSVDFPPSSTHNNPILSLGYPRADIPSITALGDHSTQHSEVALSASPFSEPVQQEGCSYKQGLKGPQSHICTWCGHEFPRKWNRDQHIKSVHEGERLYKCKQCNRKPYSRKHDLKRHMERVHKCKLQWKKSWSDIA